MNMKRAFTLIETLVAISVLLVSLAGPLSIAAQALKSAYYARDEITAFYLAQEGLEYVRALRDQNYLSSQSWLTGLDECVNAACQVDFPHFTVAACGGGICGPLLVDSTTGLFNAATGDPSGFRRSLSIVPVAGTPDEVAVDVTVSWVSAGISRSFTLSEHLFNWY
jgi:prepilin-type N-terminal cleavage/methylation domain-containing protein